MGDQGAFRDVTERRQVELALLFSEARYQAIVEDHPEMNCRFGPDKTLTFLKYVETISESAKHLRIRHKLDFESMLSVPLPAGGRTLGRITLVSRTPGPRYREHDLALAKELAGRAALVGDNARLHRDV